MHPAQPHGSAGVYSTTPHAATHRNALIYAAMVPPATTGASGVGRSGDAAADDADVTLRSSSLSAACDGPGLPTAVAGARAERRESFTRSPSLSDMAMSAWPVDIVHEPRRHDAAVRRELRRASSGQPLPPPSLHGNTPNAGVLLQHQHGLDATVSPHGVIPCPRLQSSHGARTAADVRFARSGAGLIWRANYVSIP